MVRSKLPVHFLFIFAISHPEGPLLGY